MIAPIDGPTPVPERAWIKIAEGRGEDWADWSPDGKTLYYTSQRDGHFCLWGQRLEATSHRIVGEPFGVQHFHGSASYQQGGWSVESGRSERQVLDCNHGRGLRAGIRRRLNTISVYVDRGTSREQSRLLYMNPSALSLWREMGMPATVIAESRRPPSSAVLSFGMPFSE
jgi:hypothetical protein